MKLDKEYPATHSMGTAWYAADADGNVAIFEAEDNGPVPWGMEETVVSELVFGHEENYKTHDYLNINLSDDQAYDLLDKPHSPEEEELWFECAVEIDTSKEQEFFELAAQVRNNDLICISRSRGLYRIDFFDGTEESNPSNPKEGSVLKKMIDGGIIKRVYRTKQFLMSDVYNEKDDGFKIEKDFDSVPFFIYYAPYWSELLQVRINEPSDPVKLDQVPQPLRERIPVLPIKFADTEQLQIAKYVPSHFYLDGKEINGYEYVLVPSGDGEKSWVMSDILFPVQRENCFEGESYRCGKCNNDCKGGEEQLLTQYPTVIIVYHPFNNYDYNLIITSNPIIKHGVLLPLLSHCPVGPYKCHTDWDNVKKTKSYEWFASIFKQDGFTFEHTVNRFRPYVILADERSLSILKEKYGKEGRMLMIDNIEYPLYSMQELKTLNDELEKLARKPYRGEVAPHVISIEEMEKLSPDD